MTSFPNAPRDETGKSRFNSDEALLEYLPSPKLSRSSGCTGCRPAALSCKNRDEPP